MNKVWPHASGEMARRIAGFDWTTTPLGPIEEWPQSLRSAVDLMLESAHPVFLVWSDHLTSLYNDGHAVILGAKHPSALGQPFSQVFAEVWDEFRPLVEATMAGRPHGFVDRPVALRGRPGKPMSWFTFSWSPLRDEEGEVRGFLSAAFETTDKVMAEQALLAAQQQALVASEQRYRMLFDAIDEGFCIIEMLFDESGQPFDYRFLELNPAFERHTGLAGALGRTIREFAPKHEAHWFEMYGRVARTGEPMRFQNHAEHVDDRWFDVFAFRVGAPEQHRVAVLFNDISARKRAEAALRDADRRKDEFLATLAHELRNPLAPLRNGLHIARLNSRTDDRLRNTLGMMDRQLSHLVRLVDDLLDVGRISSGKLELKQQPIEIGRALASAMESTRITVESREHRLVVDAPDEPLWVLGDHDRLSQVFVNLLGNAAKYTESGGSIRVVLDRDGNDARVRVSDSGIGIPPAAVGHVFDLFSQVREHQGRYGGGLGIGLALVKRLVALHGGSVEATSAGEGQGSTFTVRLPAIEAPHAGAGDTRAGAEARGQRQRILVADDNGDAAESLAEMLRLFGHDVWTVGDGQQALDRLDAVGPDVVILDLGMPVMDGIEAARRIRTLPQHRSVLLVALTGWGQDRDRARTAEAGFDRHLVKPVDPAEVERLLTALEPG
ncbi:hybrid sensor histidine kinase/response regulator [Piscinibacter koreensis]|uniref:histidine kinase n=1 Tax=Piscinibacter koreensis TaxID=2742824 RepID=A0A7Y6NMI4_9BURK|nr:ATP-binding protein [Schlegelella koreensis]NUZ05804.1 response regulator [Schlegelella koreensis]